MHFALISFISAGFVTGVLWFTAFFRKPLPPGPSSLLIRRNASKDEPEEPWRKYASWAVKHGSDVISLPSPTQNMIVIDNLTAATELLERRSRIYSERPLWPMAVLMGRQNNVGFSPYGPRLKLARRLLHDNMSKNVEHVWFPAVETCVRRILAGFIERRETRRECVRDEIADMLMNFAYGHNVDAQMSELMHAAGQRTNKGLQPGTWLVNYIPLLRYIPAWMPGAGFKRFADDSRAIFDDITRIPFEQVRRDIAARSDTTSYVRRSLESELVISEDDAEVVRASAGSIHDAGLGTSFSLILSFFAVLSRRPDIQERLYAEIVAAFGPGRLPTWDDRAALPFLDAVTAELARLHPPIPLMSRSVREDDVYKGYRIPGQSWIMTNLWSMLHDPHVYPQPEEFIPDRFIKSDKGSFPRDPRTIIFGFGRRICPGAQLANVLLFLLFSRTIALFKIKAQNPEKPIKYTAGLIPMPLPFECTLVPRVENANELIMESKS